MASMLPFSESNCKNILNVLPENFYLPINGPGDFGLEFWTSTAVLEAVLITLAGTIATTKK